MYIYIAVLLFANSRDSASNRSNAAKTRQYHHLTLRPNHGAINSLMPFGRAVGILIKNVLV